ncbi:MAG TPA: enolase C-terminal domain-like protein [Pirellulales bacterium]|nr:enolase C-terminal domain-like protein [Pirellulales bacterium]
MFGSTTTESITNLDVSVYTIPTESPESDGTFSWDSTTIVLVALHAGDASGIGFTYADTATARLIHDKLAELIIGCDVFDIPAAVTAMQRAIRNLGRPGIASMAISAVDVALWDLKARLLDVPLVSLLGAARESVPIYGSGGFTSYDDRQLRRQLGGWVEQGIPRVKMKIGRDPAADIGRVRSARDAIGRDAELFVDANGAYIAKQALAQAERFAEFGVAWFEEPVSSDDLAGLRLMRDRGPAGMDIAAGEYGYDPFYFRRMLEAEAVDVLQADATRCGGITGFLHAGSLCAAWPIPLSAHTAPSIHAHVCCSLPQVCHLEYFHDHVRIERMLFDGVLEPVGGELRTDRSRPGLGLELKTTDAEQWERHLF